MDGDENGGVIFIHLGALRLMGNSMANGRATERLRKLYELIVTHRSSALKWPGKSLSNSQFGLNV